MGIFKTEICPVCGERTNAAQKVMAKIDGKHLCKSCAEKLLEAKINLFELKKYDIEQIRTAISKCDPLSVEGDTAYEKLSNLMVQNPSLTLKKEEVCFYQHQAIAYNEKNVVTGSKGRGAGASVRVAKGLSIRMGGGGSDVIRETIGEKFPGTFFITNMRIVLLATKFGFDIPIAKIQNIEQFANGIAVYSGAKCHRVIIDQPLNVVTILQLMNDAFSEQESSRTKNSTLKESSDTLRTLKGLFDDGIITQEEFNLKKKELLGL